MNDNNPIQAVGLVCRIAIMFYDSILLIALLFFASLPVAVPLEMTIDHPYYPIYILYIHLVAFLFLVGVGRAADKRLVQKHGKSNWWQTQGIKSLGSMHCCVTLAQFCVGLA